MDTPGEPVDARAGARGRRLAAAALVASPVLLVPTAVGVLLLPGLAALLGPRAWPGWSARRSAVLGAQTLAATVIGVVLAFVVVGLCGPEGRWSGAALLAGVTLWGAVSALAVVRPAVWPLAPLAGAAGVDGVGAVACAVGVPWIC